MPELPEVETTCRGIRPHLLSRRIIGVRVRQPQLRWPVPTQLEDLLSQAQILKISRRSKYILIATDRGTLLLHLGMSGRLRVIQAAKTFDKHDHVDFIFDNDTFLRFTDPRRFGSILWTDKPIFSHRLLAHLGPEPLTQAFNAQYLNDQTRGRKSPIKHFIMNSRIVVGVGNIYANEALYASKIAPYRQSDSLDVAECQELVTHIKAILRHAIRRGGTTLKDFSSPEGLPGYFALELQVYGRKGQPCKSCSNKLVEIRQQNRSSVYCAFCQK